MFLTILKALADLGMAFGPVAGYVYQYFLIYRRQQVGTFSIDLCGIMLFSNILRIAFYYYQPYELSLLTQSFLMIFVHIMLLKICVKLINNQKLVKSLAQTNSNSQQIQQQKNAKSSFWKWQYFSTFCKVIVSFAAFILGTSILLKEIGFIYYGQILGFIGLVVQGVLMVPQAYQNYKQGRVKGLSYLLVLAVTSADLFQFGYYLLYVPLVQFLICGSGQLLMDFVIIGQIFYYKICCKRSEESQELQDTASSSAGVQIQQPELMQESPFINKQSEGDLAKTQEKFTQQNTNNSTQKEHVNY